MNLKTSFRTLLGIMMTLPLVGLAVAQDTATQEKVDYKKVIADYIEATGGEAAHKKIKSISAKGTISIPSAGLEGEVQMSQIADKARMEMEIAGIGKQQVGYDGDTVWQVSQMTGSEILEGERRKQVIRDMALSPMLEIEKLYDSIECTGVEKFNDKDCYVLVMKSGDDEPVYNYFAVDSKLLAGTKTTVSDPNIGKMEVVTKVSDYADFDGVKMSKVSTVELPQGMQMVTKMDEIKVNGDIDNKLFDLPAEIEELKEESSSDK